MKDEEIRIAIAEACGAEWFRSGDGEMCLSFGRPPFPLGPGRTEVEEDVVLAGNIPGYPTDLNAMHEAEKALTQRQIPVYQRHLYELPSADEDWKRTASQRAVHATARQRCEAFLRTLSLWKEDDR